MSSTTVTFRHVVAAAAVGTMALVGVTALAPAGPTWAGYSTLSDGDEGEEVEALQRALSAAGYEPVGDPDGVYGPGTVAAVERFQSGEGLNATGSVDRATAIALGLEKSSLFGLAAGDSGDSVTSLQRKLIAAGHGPETANGEFGASTTDAVKAFQAAVGYLPTGEVNAATAVMLEPLAEAETSSAQRKFTDDNAESDEQLLSDTDSDSGGSTTAEVGETAAIRVSIGSRGGAVARVQQILLDGGYDVVGGADGVFGALTANALMAFQGDVGMVVDGIVGPNTAAELAKLETGERPAGAGAKGSNGSWLGLKYGSVGDNVKAVQQSLVDAGIDLPGGVDGVFGSMTQTALKSFQAANGLEQSGKVDPSTAAALGGAAQGASKSDATEPASSNGSILGLKHGSLGSLVKQLQQALMDAGVTVRGGADGIFGPATHQALVDFQKANGLDGSGVVDEATVAAFESPAGATSNTSPESNESGGDLPVYGDVSNKVRSLQQALIDAGIKLRGGVDGVFGAATAAAVMTFQDRNGFTVTGKVDAATADALDMKEVEAPAGIVKPASITLSHDPVASPCGFGDTWHAPRSGGRLHLGVDVIASEGQTVYAAAAGRIEKVYTEQTDSLAGNGVRLVLPDGTYLFYAHLSGLADGIALGVPVESGQVLGTVGSTGNANTPHLHFEVHPNGGAAVNPYPILKAMGAC